MFLSTMWELSLKYLRCVNCGSKLELEAFERSNEIKEGLLFCLNCNSKYPIISKVPILWSDFVSYLSNRAQLGGYLVNQAKNSMLKSFVKNTLKKINRQATDVTCIEKRWVTTYKNSLKSKFYTHIKNSIKRFPTSNLVLEHGCSIGHITQYLAQKHDTVFGIDQSFFAITEAKKNNAKNLDYFVANSLRPPFGKTRFGMVVVLNMLELIEPLDLLKVISSQLKGTVVISDPYDFERGKDSIKHRVDEKSLRIELKKLGFVLVQNTKKPSFIPWKLNINSRLNLNYKVDLIVARNSTS